MVRQKRLEANLNRPLARIHPVEAGQGAYIGAEMLVQVRLQNSEKVLERVQLPRLLPRTKIPGDLL